MILSCGADKVSEVGNCIAQTAGCYLYKPWVHVFCMKEKVCQDLRLSSADDEKSVWEVKVTKADMVPCELCCQFCLPAPLSMFTNSF